MTNKLYTESIITARKLLCALEFEVLHREFLEVHDDDYWLAEPDRLCFFDCARLDVIGHFGESGWLPESGGYRKNIDGITIKLMADAGQSPEPITLSKTLPKLDAVASQGCKISIPIHGNN